MNEMAAPIRPIPAPPANLPDITTVILTYNEEIHIERAIAVAKSMSRDVLVVDSYSTDRTVELALQCGARVLQNPWINHSRQFQWGLEHGDITTAWIHRLDADEILEPDLVARLCAEVPTLPADVAGVVFSRKHIFMGRWIKHGGRYPLHMLRLWRTGQGRVEDRWMDEHVLVWGGRTIRMAGGFADASEHDLTFFIAKHNGYATREAIEVINHRYGLFADTKELTAENSSWQASTKRFIKNRIYNRLPLGAGPLGYFLIRYFLQLGFLDGQAGLCYHFLQGFWYRFLVDAKVAELEPHIAGITSREERVAILARLTGLKL